MNKHKRAWSNRTILQGTLCPTFLLCEESQIYAIQPAFPTSYGLESVTQRRGSQTAYEISSYKQL